MDAKIMGFATWLTGLIISFAAGAEMWQAFIAGSMFGIWAILMNTKLEKQ